MLAPKHIQDNLFENHILIT